MERNLRPAGGGFTAHRSPRNLRAANETAKRTQNSAGRENEARVDTVVVAIVAAVLVGVLAFVVKRARQYMLVARAGRMQEERDRLTREAEQTLLSSGLTQGEVTEAFRILGSAEIIAMIVGSDSANPDWAQEERSDFFRGMVTRLVDSSSLEPSPNMLSTWLVSQPDIEYACTDCGRKGYMSDVQPQHPAYAEAHDGIALCSECVDGERDEHRRSVPSAAQCRLPWCFRPAVDSNEARLCAHHQAIVRFAFGAETPTGPGVDARFQMSRAERREVLADYGEVLEAQSHHVHGISERLLPHPRDRIQQAIREELLSGEQPEMADSLEVAYVGLAAFLPEPDGSIGMAITRALSAQPPNDEEGMRNLAGDPEWGAALQHSVRLSELIGERTREAMGQLKALKRDSGGVR